jgi:hypothetical protein
MLRAAQLVGCEWCPDFGSWLAVNGGVAEDKLRELTMVVALENLYSRVNWAFGIERGLHRGDVLRASRGLA